MGIKLTILGCHSATLRGNAFPTSQYLEINNCAFLIDCGEGTQRLLRKNKINFSKIKHIFISHLHGDHCFGLIGLLSTFGLLNRNLPLHIYAPKGIKKMINTQLKFSGTFLKYELLFHELSSEKSEVILDNEKIKVRTIPLKHRIYTNGFLFEEPSKMRTLNMKIISQNLEIQICDYHNLKKGADFITKEGFLIKNEKLTFPPEPPKSYAFCSDTSYFPEIIPIIENVDLLYHEATFLEDRLQIAQKTGHSTAKQAARLAKKAKVQQLILGHYSSRYKDISLFEKEAKTVFENTHLAASGKIFEL